jgi:integrase
MKEKVIMPRIGNNIYKRKDGRWEGRYIKNRSDNGKVIYGYIYAKTCTEVKERLKAVSRETPKSSSHKITVAETAKKWLSVVTLKVKASTLAGYEAIIKLHITPLLGEKTVSELSTALISEFAQTKLINGRVDGKGGLSSKTVRDILSVLKEIVDFAVSEKLINQPVIITYPKNQQKTMRVLSNSEQSALKSILLEEITIYKAGILLCLYTGLRVGELCGLCWQDFSSKFDKLSVCRSMRRIKNENSDSKTKIIIDTPKSKSSLRDIPIPKFLSPILNDFMRREDTYFLSTAENYFIEPRTMQNHFSRVIKVANISDANFHCLRHTFSTRCIEAGVDIKSLSEMLGHASVNITLNRYVHSSFEQKREGMNRLEQYLDL